MQKTGGDILPPVPSGKALLALPDVAQTDAIAGDSTSPACRFGSPLPLLAYLNAVIPLLAEPPLPDVTVTRLGGAIPVKVTV